MWGDDYHLQDVAYQLGLRIDGDPVSGCIADRGILFPDASDSRVHIRWPPYWRTLRRMAGYRGARLCWHGCTAKCAMPRSMVNAIWVGALACCCPGSITIFCCYGPMTLILVSFH
ncbi:hypothetical protein Ahy_A05g023348 isoform B [Arachis hypogaea]|uniref:Aminotransferase-like plant mobile domain-containing protein n=1 Tax=Arachis hypogaea TaxID=3818 RepID=A0A445D333_ARAHY|nr:hypothetical protein Ahy_A05g023348 isoform B [Arachis hypogaea]